MQDLEVENGGSAPRILCLDDYFMVESEKMEVERDTGRKFKTKVSFTGDTIVFVNRSKKNAHNSFNSVLVKRW